jgi:hypothetical protein
MAYAREENDKLEVSYPLAKIWEAIPKAIEMLDWKILETDECKHYLKIKTKGGFISYSSTMKVFLEVIDEKNTKLTIGVETPVTTISAMADYGRSRERIEQFVVTLAKLMESPKAKP